MNACCVDLRGLTAAADPLLQPLGQRGIIEFQSAPQGTFPDNQHAPALRHQRSDITLVTRHVLADFGQPELGARRRDFKQITVVMVPETAVGKDNALIIVEDEIRAACQRRILDAKLKATVG
ncbi:hypothetical protein D3C72_600770 [compost metagenome]